MRAPLHTASFIAPLSRLVVLTAEIRELAAHGQRSGLILERAGEAITLLHRLAQTNRYPSEALSPDRVEALLSHPRSIGDGLGALEGVVGSFRKRSPDRAVSPPLYSSHWQLAAMSGSGSGGKKEPEKSGYVERTKQRWRGAKDEEIRASIAKKVGGLLDRQALNDLLDLIAWVPHDRVISFIREAFESEGLTPFVEALLVDPGRILQGLGVDRENFSPSDRFQQFFRASQEQKDQPSPTGIEVVVPPPQASESSQVPEGEPDGAREAEILALATTVSDLDQLRALVGIVGSPEEKGNRLRADSVEGIMTRVLDRVREKKISGRKNDAMLYTDYQIQKLRGSLYLHDPTAAVAAWHKMTTYGWILGGVKFDKNFEGILASLRWLAEREKESGEEKKKAADFYWEMETRLKGREPTVPSGSEDPHLHWWEKQLRAFGHQLNDRENAVQPGAEQAWKDYLVSHPDVRSEIGKLAASPLPAASELARAILEMVK